MFYLKNIIAIKVLLITLCVLAFYTCKTPARIVIPASPSPVAVCQEDITRDNIDNLHLAATYPNSRIDVNYYQPIDNAVISPNGQYVAIVLRLELQLESDTIHQYVLFARDLEDGNIVYGYQSPLIPDVHDVLPYPYPIDDITFIDDETLAFIDYAGLHIVDIETGDTRDFHEVDGTHLAASRTGDYLAVAQTDQVQTVDLRTQTVTQNSSFSNITAMVFSATAAELIIGDREGYIYVYDVTNNEFITSWRGHTSQVYALAATTSEDTLVASVSASRVELRKAQTGKAIYDVDGVLDGLLRNLSIGFINESHLLVIPTLSGRRVIDTQTGSSILDIPEHRSFLLVPRNTATILTEVSGSSIKTWCASGE